MAEISPGNSDTFDLQLLLDDSSKWNDLFMNPGGEDHARECGARRLRVQDSDDRPFSAVIDACMALLLAFDQITFCQF